MAGVVGMEVMVMLRSFTRSDVVLLKACHLPGLKNTEVPTPGLLHCL
jgi:hypothetical protein